MVDRTIEELNQNQDDTLALLDQILTRLSENDARVAAKDAEIAALIAASNLSAADKAALQAKIDAAVQKSEDVENKARAGIPQVPPVGTPPLLSSYADRASFDAAAAAYAGPENVTIDGAAVTTAFTGSKAGAIDYFTQTDNSVSTSPTGAP